MDDTLLTLVQMKNHRKILALLFDGIRTVDPIKKKIVEYRENKPAESEFKCYDSWKRNKICDNCISMRAILDKKVHYKLEYGNGRVFLVAAVPLQDSGCTLALELSKDITDSMLVENWTGSNDQIFKFIDSMNQKHVRDSLTGLWNRRYIDERLPVEIMNSVTEGTPLTIIMADIDHFKKVNDTFGHLGGDHTLQQFAELLAGSVEDRNGWAARYGGEEFMLCLRTSGKVAVQFAEKLREGIEKKDFQYNGQSIRITSSFGISTLGSGSSQITAESFINHADTNLYAAKNAGRNRVVYGETGIQ